MDIQGKLENYQKRYTQVETYIKQLQEQLQKSQLELVALTGAIAALEDVQKDEQTPQESTESD